MVERLNLEPEVLEILQHIDNSNNFLLSGGAGSGKTYSLVQLINQLILENPNKKVACMTYTNAAVKEIGERFNHNNLFVSTIHDFIWDNIKHFQKELKISLIDIMNDSNSRINAPEGEIVDSSYFDRLIDGIQYKEYLRIKEGIISHDEVLIVANHLYKNYSKLCDILKDKYKYILIDEYQDTSKYIVEILLKHLGQSKKKNIIGFFGDSMQAIYESGIGDLDAYKTNEGCMVREVIKSQNRRNPLSVINLANILRTDGITQIPSSDQNAPNMQDGNVKTGNIKFYYSSDSDIDIEKIKTFIGWNFDDSDKTKILNLTHNLIAPKAGFSNLMEIYDKDRIIEYVKKIKKHIKNNDIKNDFSQKTLGDVISFLNSDKFENETVQPTTAIQRFIDENKELYDYAKSLLYEKISKIYLDKDQLLDDKKQNKEDENKKGSKRDNLIKHLFKIQNNISLYLNNQFNEFIRNTEYKIKSVNDKKKLKDKIESLINMNNITIEEVINIADEIGICKKDDKLIQFIVDKEYVYNRVKKVNYSEFQNLYKYLEGYTPYSTQHKTKGTEFDNVLVILDNGGWNNYNFVRFFEKRCSESIFNRTSKIFYVCCTRTKENLAVYFQNPSEKVIQTAKEWFGENNIDKIETNIDK